MKRPSFLAVLAVLFSMIAIFGGPSILADDNAAVPSFGMGMYVNEGYGSNGYSVVPGFTLRFDRFPVGVHVGFGSDTLAIALNADWLAIDAYIPGTKFSWFAGPGAYAGWAFNAAGPDSFAVGLRGFVGGRVLVFDKLEAYISLVPAFGVGYIDGRQTWLWNIDREFGLRYIIALKKSVAEGPRLAHEAESAVIPVAAPEEIPAPIIEATPEPLAQLPVEKTYPAIALSSIPAFSPVGNPSSLAILAKPSVIDDLASWRLDLINKDGNAAHSFNGTGTFPRDLVWNGKNYEGKIIDGVYYGSLSLVYSDGSMGESALAPVLLDNKAPVISANLPVGFVFTPESGGSNETLTLAVGVINASPIVSWTFDIDDPTGKPFYHNEGLGPLPDAMSWDGRATSGELVQSAQAYNFRLAATDSLSKQGRATGTIRTGILLDKSDDGYRLGLSSLLFRPNQADLVDDDSASGKANAEILAQLVTLFGQYPQHRITIIGHAMNLSGMQKEEAEVKLLSLARADKAKQHLVKLGIEAERISTQGMGSAQPIVPDSDKANSWKNRRVEILLTTQ